MVCLRRAFCPGTNPGCIDRHLYDDWAQCRTHEFTQNLGNILFDAPTISDYNWINSIAYAMRLAQSVGFRLIASTEEFVRRGYLFSELLSSIIARRGKCIYHKVRHGKSRC